MSAGVTRTKPPVWGVGLTAPPPARAAPAASDVSAGMTWGPVSPISSAGSGGGGGGAVDSTGAAVAPPAAPPPPAPPPAPPPPPPAGPGPTIGGSPGSDG